jgi:hypothetical protein
MSDSKKRIEASKFIELTCDFADEIMQKQLGDEYDNYIQGNDDLGYSYTEDGQDIFNELLADVEQFLDKFGIVNDEWQDLPNGWKMKT